MALPGYNNDEEIKEILSGFGGNQLLNSYSPSGSGGRYRTGRTGRRQRINHRNVSPLPGSLEEEFKVGFSNKRNQREIQQADSTEQTTDAQLVVEEQEE